LNRTAIATRSPLWIIAISAYLKFLLALAEKLLMKRKSFLSVGLIFLATLALVASCNSNSDTKTSPEAEGTKTPAVAASSQVRLGFSAWPGWFPWQVTKDLNLFEASKATVDLQWFPSYTDSIGALNSAKLDANSQTLGDTISSIAGGADLVVVMTNDRSTGNDKVIANKSITSIADLKGKKVAAEEGTVDHFLLLQGLKKAGLTVKDIKFVPMETSRAVNAFKDGQVDAVAVFAPFTTAALKVAGSKELFSSKDFPGSITDHLVFTRKFINEHPDAVQATVDSWFATLTHIKANPDDDKILAKRAGVGDPDYGTTESDYKAYAQGTTILSLDENLKAFQPGNDMNSLFYAAQQTSEFLTEAGLVKTKPDLSKLFDDRFVKAAIAKAKK
jgi:NitT/TauT family transport system substrate-binding protein